MTDAIATEQLLVICNFIRHYRAVLLIPSQLQNVYVGVGEKGVMGRRYY